MDEIFPREPLTLKALNKIIGKLKFLYRKNKFLIPPLRKMLLSALVRQHCQYGYSEWYPNLCGKKKKEIQIAQTKCICFCVKLTKRHRISAKIFSQLTGCLSVKGYIGA